MRRWTIRWQAVLPRLLLVIFVLVGAQYLLGRGARTIADRSVEAAVAAKVEVGNARVSLLDRRVVLDRLRMANPHRPTENLLQADRCELDVAVGPLLYKRTIIDQGRVVGLRIDSEANDGATGCEGQTRAPTHNWLANDADEPARQWLAELKQRFQQPLERQFESLERSAALGARWPGEFAALEKRGTELKRRALGLQEATDSAEVNRLRYAEFFNALPGHVAALRKKSAELGAEIEKLSASLEAERRTIIAARQRDERRLHDLLTLESIDPSALTAYLLSEQMARPLDELLGWLRWARRVVPAEAAAPSPRKRGEDILFAGGRSAPNFLIRALQLQGTAHFDQESVELRGELTDVTNVPSRHTAPIRLRLTGAGSLPLDLQATIDRTGEAARDELLVDCRRIALPEFRLGRSGELEIGLAPSDGSLSISVAVEGEKLTGDIQLVQKKVCITPVLHGELNDLRLVSPLHAMLSNVDSVATRLSLSGTLDEPSSALWSNLGPAVAEAMNQAVQQVSDEHAQSVLAGVRRQVDERLAALDRQLSEERSKHATELSSVVDELETIAGRQTPRERISVDQLGRRLPSNSLFR